MSSTKGSDMCKGCKIKVKRNDEGLKCDECDGWYHVSCENINKELYKVLKEYEELLWLCSSCESTRKNKKSLKMELEETNKKLKDMEEKMETFRTEVINEVAVKLRSEWIVEVGRLRTDVVEEVNKVREKVNEISQGMNMNDNGNSQRPTGAEQVVLTVAEVQSKVLEELEEAEEKKRRANNLVIYNVPESDRDKAEERVEVDETWCLGVFSDCLGVRVEKDDVERVIRLGKRPEGGQNRPRPVLLKLKNQNLKWEVLENAKKLKNAGSPTYRKIGIAKDMTRREREQFNRLKQELKEKTDAGEEGWKIKNLKLIREEVRGRRDRSVGLTG